MSSVLVAAHRDAASPVVLPAVAAAVGSRHTLGEWTLADPLGEGASAIVYAAHPSRAEPSANPDYALKVLRPELARKSLWVRQFRREGILGRLLEHPHAIPVLGGALKEPPFYLVLPRLRGSTVARVLRGAGAFACAHAVWVVRQVADALGLVHDRGWLHGDVKPDNIHISPEGHATLFDFGMATPVNQAGELHDRRLAGTLAYCAPEQFTSRLTIGPASDVYSLGITFFELLTGHCPFTADHPTSLVESHLQRVPPSPRSFAPHLPRDVAACVNRMLAKDPGRRPTTDGELQATLMRLEIQTFTLRGRPEA